MDCLRGGSGGRFPFLAPDRSFSTGGTMREFDKEQSPGLGKLEKTRRQANCRGKVRWFVSLSLGTSDNPTGVRPFPKGHSS